MPYTEATIRETIRINPTNPVGVFRVALETTELCGYTIPKVTEFFVKQINFIITSISVLGNLDLSMCICSSFRFKIVGRS